MKRRDDFVMEQGKDIYRDICFDILDSMVDKVKVIDRDRNIIYYNQAMKEAAKDISVGKICYCTFERDGHCDVCTSIRAMAQDRSFEKEEVIGGKVYSVKSSPVKDPDGRIYGAVEVYRDVTKEKRLEMEITSRNKEMMNDLNFSKVMQMAILPPKGRIGNIVIDYLYKPCETLSGDMFDVFQFDEDKIVFYIADVAGHGVTTSMTTMFIRQTIRGAGEIREYPEKIFSLLHREYRALGLDVEKYFTIFYGVYNQKTRRLKYANAGHNAEPLLARKNVVERLRVPGVPIITLLERTEYKEKETYLDTGDRIFLFTDGIVEAKNRFGEEFGMERIVEEVRNFRSVDEIERVKNRVEGYVYGNAMDDYAILKLYFL